MPMSCDYHTFVCSICLADLLRYLQEHNKASLLLSSISELAVSTTARSNVLHHENFNLGVLSRGRPHHFSSSPSVPRDHVNTATYNSKTIGECAKAQSHAPSKTSPP